jgi:hypothetical protein
MNDPGPDKTPRTDARIAALFALFAIVLLACYAAQYAPKILKAFGG